MMEDRKVGIPTCRRKEKREKRNPLRRRKDKRIKKKE